MRLFLVFAVVGGGVEVGCVSIVCEIRKYHVTYLLRKKREFLVSFLVSEEVYISVLLFILFIDPSDTCT